MGHLCYDMCELAKELWIENCATFKLEVQTVLLYDFQMDMSKIASFMRFMLLMKDITECPLALTLNKPQAILSV